MLCYRPAWLIADVDTAAMPRLDQPHRDEDLEGLADDPAADIEDGAQISFGWQAFAPREFAAADRRFDLVDDLLP